MTLDGFVAGANNDLDWFKPPMNDQELNKDIVAIAESADTYISGYPTGLGLVAYWTNAEKNRQTENWEMAIAKPFNRLHPIIISNKEERLDPGLELVVVRTDQEFAQRVNEIKQRKGGNIYVPGGVRTGQNVVRLGLVDECILMMHPVAIGEGKPFVYPKDKPAACQRQSIQIWSNPGPLSPA